MKCPKCGGAPDNMVLTSNPVKYRCSQCDYVGARGPWMEHAKQAHAERLQAAVFEARSAEEELSSLQHWEHVEAISRLIDAKVTLALLERDS